jgi:tetratricopeptide (TPR) repeat protein
VHSPQTGAALAVAALLQQCLTASSYPGTQCHSCCEPTLYPHLYPRPYAMPVSLFATPRIPCPPPPYCRADQPVTAARLKSGRALAYEGLSQWEAALQDYMAALDLAAAAGESPDAYIINSIGNCQNSLRRWAEARESYLTSSQLFQQAKVCWAGAVCGGGPGVGRGGGLYPVLSSLARDGGCEWQLHACQLIQAKAGGW